MQHISQLSANVLHGVLFVQVLPCPRWSGGSGLWRGGRRHACSLRAGAALLSLQPVLFVIVIKTADFERQKRINPVISIT
jgi:hypothetical protein